MAKVKIQGHASGTGVFTLTSPNSNTDRTITLPDADVTLGTDATKLPLAGGTMTGTIAGFTSTGIDDNADATAITIDSNEKVGIGETAPLGYLHVKNGDSGQGSVNAAGNSLVLESNGSTGITFLSGSSSNTSIIMGDSESNYQGVIIYDHSLNAFKFATTGTERMRIDSSGKVGIGTVSPDETLDVEGTIQTSRTDGYTANWKQMISHASSSYNGTLYFTGSTSTGGVIFRPNGNTTVSFPVAGGITFNGDTASQNALDDYEEGSWTPVMNGTSSNTIQATYVKVGNMVTCHMMNWGFTATAVTCSITGLPFTSTGAYVCGTCASNNWTENGAGVWGYTAGTVTVSDCVNMDDGTGRAGSPRYFSMSITYRTT